MKTHNKQYKVSIKDLFYYTQSNIDHYRNYLKLNDNNWISDRDIAILLAKEQFSINLATINAYKELPPIDANINPPILIMPSGEALEDSFDDLPPTLLTLLGEANRRSANNKKTP